MLCPDNMKEHVLKVLQGEYDIPELDLKEPVILDIGANVGAFSVWACGRWPNAKIVAYEPNPESFAILEKNCPNNFNHCLAVSDQDGEGFLYDGHTNQGECSLLYLNASETGQFVKTVSAANLPPCDIMKIDTEGMELPILCTYEHLSAVKAVLLEWHSSADRYRIGSRMCEMGFNIVSDAAWAVNAGIMKWARIENYEARLYYRKDLACQTN